MKIIRNCRLSEGEGDTFVYALPKLNPPWEDENMRGKCSIDMNNLQVLVKGCGSTAL